MGQTTHKSIKDWREEERPVEKLMARGAGALTNAELLAVLIHTGSGEKSAVALAGEILDLAGNSLRDLSNTSKERLLAVKGVGTTKLASLTAAFEIGRRMTSDSPATPTISCPKDVAGYMAPHFAGLDHEECWVIYLNRSNRVISKECISTGGISSTVMDVKIITKRAIEKMASGIIITHNHPSGNLRPGGQDMKVTASLKEALALLDIALLDHVIMGDNGKYFSFSDGC
ncbi:MAG: DNA repair protein RadC [Bacteroidales bacterium]|nr:DNA repair protein RadC [Candidatus Equibacterium intestinale]